MEIFVKVVMPKAGVTMDEETIAKAIATQAMDFEELACSASIITINVKPSDDIDTLKILIQGHEGYLPDNQLLIFAGKQLQNDGDGWALEDYDIHEGSVLELIVLEALVEESEPEEAESDIEDKFMTALLDKNPEGNREDKLIVVVKNLDMVDIYIDVAENDSIRVVKAKIQDKEGYPMHDQRLVYRGKTPNDDTTLSSLNVKQGNKLHFTLELDGGGTS